MSHLTRRALLRMAGYGAGAALFAPLLRARAQGAAPRRFVIVVEGNCFEPVTHLTPVTRAALDASMAAPVGADRWWYRRYRHAAPLVVEDQLAQAPALAALAGDVDLQARAAVLLGLSSRIAGGGHSSHAGALSCTRSTAAKAAGPTIDTVLAGLPQVRRGAPFEALRLGTTSAHGARLVYSLCAYAAGRPASVITNPTVAFNYVFGSVAGGGGRKAFVERGELLDYARTDVTRALREFRGDARERAKLERYLTSLEEVAGRQAQLLDMSDTLARVKPPGPGESELFDATDPLPLLRAQFAVAAAALQGELTNVVVLSSGAGGGFDLSYRSLRAPVGRHDLHHQSAGNAGFRDLIHQVTGEHVGMVAGLARQLAATPELGAEGSMLDHTAILFISDNGEQHHSTASEWPALLLGGERLGLRTGGRTVVYPGIGADGHRQVSNLFNTLGHAAGLDLNEFGAEGANRVAPGPLPELFG